MKNSIRRCLAIVITVALTVNSTLYAASFGDSASYGKYSIGTVKRVDGDPNKIQYMIGGKYTFKIRRNSIPQFFYISPPEFKAGCGGLSFKGMFMSLLNLDQISVALKNAGTAFAYGFMMGLVYSLPGIAAVFEKLNDWARKIQALLANACSAGMALGREYGNSEQFKGAKGLFGQISAADKQISNWMQDKSSNIQGKLVDLLSGTNDSDMDTSSIKIEKKYQIVAKIMEHYFEKTGLFSSAIYSYSQNGNVNVKDLLSINDTSKPLMDKTGSDGVPFTNDEYYNLYLFMTIVMFNMFGETYAMPQPAYESIKTTVDDAVRLIEGGADKKEVEARFKDIADSYSNPNRVLTALRADVTLNAQDVINWLREGVVSEGMQNMVVPRLVYLNIPPAKPTATSLVYLADSEEVVPVSNTKWNQMLTKYGNIKRLAVAQTNCLFRNNSGYSDLSCAELPPIISPKPKFYKKVYEVTPSKERTHLEEYLTWANNYYLTLAVIDFLKSVSKAILSHPSAKLSVANGKADQSLASGYNMDQYKALVEKVEKIIQELEKEITVENSEMLDHVLKIDNLFEKQNKKNIQRSLKLINK